MPARQSPKSSLTECEHCVQSLSKGKLLVKNEILSSVRQICSQKYLPMNWIIVAPIVKEFLPYITCPRVPCHQEWFACNAWLPGPPRLIGPCGCCAPGHPTLLATQTELPHWISFLWSSILQVVSYWIPGWPLQSPDSKNPLLDQTRSPCHIASILVSYIGEPDLPRKPHKQDINALALLSPSNWYSETYCLWAWRFYWIVMAKSHSWISCHLNQCC